MSRFPSLKQALLLGTAMVLASGMVLTTCTTRVHAAPPPTPSQGYNQPALPRPGPTLPPFEYPKEPPPPKTEDNPPGYSQGVTPPSNDLVRAGGVWNVTALVNGNTHVTFIVDSGAADVSISRQLFNKLWRDGSIKQADMLGKQEYRTASNKIMIGQMFTLRSIQIGEKIAYNVQASVSNEMPNDGMLLGMTFLAKFDSWSIDNKNNKLVLN